MARSARRMLTGPAGGPPPPVFDFLDFTAPVSPDNSDNPVSLGLTFAITEPGTWVGNRIYLPGAPGVAWSIQGWNVDTSTKLFDVPGTGTPGGYVNSLAVPTPIVDGVTYMAVMWTDRYAFTGAYPYPATSLDGKIHSGMQAFFDYGPAPVFPTSTSAANFYISPILEFP